MKKVLVPIMMIGLVSCKPSVEDTCKCFKESANELMLQGIKPSEGDLGTACKIKQEDYNAQEMASIGSCAMEVMESVNQKKLIPIDGKPVPDFPSYTFKTLDEFSASLANGVNSEYKYLKTHITIQEAYSNYRPLYPDNEAELSASNADNSFSLLLSGNPNDMDTTKFATPTGINSYGDYNIVWDVENKKMVEDEQIKWILQDANNFNSQAFIGAAMDNQMETFKVSNTTLNMYEKYMVIIIEKMLATEEYKNLINDLKNGRYKLVDKDELPSTTTTQFSFSGTYYGVNSAYVYGTTVSSRVMLDAKLFNIHSMGLPPVLTTRGNSVDVSKYLLSNLKQ